MTQVNQNEWIEKLKAEGFEDVRVCPLPPLEGTPEHTHDEHTVHIILSGNLEISDSQGIHIYQTGDRVEFPAGTIHKAKSLELGEMIVGVKK
jgi:quercetin dioxygenase-like cupin family protein